MYRDTLPEPITLLVSRGTGGVRDYADLVSQQLPLGAVATLMEDECTLPTTPPQHLVLQYSGYGFARRGTPLWLPERLRELKRSALSVGVYFHELFANGWPWQSAFWLSHAQRRIVCQLAEVADYWITNREASRHWISARTPSRPHAVLPVFSNVGEPGITSQARTGDAVVFGSGALRSSFYQRHGAALLEWVQTRGVRIHDIGSPVAPEIASALFASGAVQVHGRLDSADVRALMQRASFGLVDYPVAYIAKSGVFGAYCAHGLVPVVFSDAHANGEGLEPGRHYLTTLPTQAVDVTLQAALSQAAWDWYRPHRVAAHASTLLALIEQRHHHAAQVRS